MISIRFLPLFALGCATLPTAPDETPLDDDQLEDNLEDNREDNLEDNDFEGSDFDAMDEQQVRSFLWDNLFTLQGVEVVQVGDLLLDLPEEAICAYNWTPCSGFDEVVEEALREAAPRLEALSHFANVATNEAPTSRSATCAEDVILENIEQLADLEIVQIGDLNVAEPEHNCPYDVPCDEDIAAANEITCERAEVLDRIVALTQGL
jgi:hypothetical protein